MGLQQGPRTPQNFPSDALTCVSGQHYHCFEPFACLVAQGEGTSGMDFRCKRLCSAELPNSTTAGREGSGQRGNGAAQGTRHATMDCFSQPFLFSVPAPGVWAAELWNPVPLPHIPPSCGSGWGLTPHLDTGTCAHENEGSGSSQAGKGSHLESVAGALHVCFCTLLLLWHLFIHFWYEYQALVDQGHFHVPPPPLAHARRCLSTGWALNRLFEEILGPLFLWSRMEDRVSVERLYRERGAHSCL